MAKFDPKKADLNKDGKLSDYEENVGKKRAAAMKMGHSPKKMDHAMKMDKSPMYNYKKGYAMQMGSREIDSPSAFNMKDAANIAASPMMNHEPGHFTSKQIEDFASDVYKYYKGRRFDRGGYVNERDTGRGEAYDTQGFGLPKGVFQDYLRSGGSKNPRVAADIFRRAAKYADFNEPMIGVSEFDEKKNSYVNKQVKRYSGFSSPYGIGLSTYSPKKGFMGFDPQTGKKKYYGPGGAEGSGKYSTDFQESMRTGIEVHKYGVGGKNYKKPKMEIAKVGGALKGTTLTSLPAGVPKVTFDEDKPKKILRLTSKSRKKYKGGKLKSKPIIRTNKGKRVRY